MDGLDILGGVASAATGGLAGAVIRLLPALFGGVAKMFTAAGDRKHELEMRRLDWEIAKSSGEQRIREIDQTGIQAQATAMMDAYKAALEAQGRPTGIPWVDALNTFVRPFTAYYFLSLYGIAKVCLIVYAWAVKKVDLAALSKVIWTPDDSAMFGAVMGFYFVDRQLGKSEAKANPWNSVR